MTKRGKTLLAILLIAVVFILIYWQRTTPNTLQGLIKKGEPVDTAQLEKEQSLGLSADLKAGIEVLPADADGNLMIRATIENAGDGSILGNIPFRYSVYINDTEIFTNVDSYTSMDPGDAFSFDYPISKAIYQYPEKGTVKFVVDSENAITEKNEADDTAVAGY